MKMTAEKCREDFEKWASRKFDTRLLKSANGDYKLTALQNMWLSWQASRQALEIALPVIEQQEREIPKSGYKCPNCGNDGWSASCDHCIPY